MLCTPSRDWLAPGIRSNLEWNGARSLSLLLMSKSTSQAMFHIPSLRPIVASRIVSTQYMHTYMYSLIFADLQLCKMYEFRMRYLPHGSRSLMLTSRAKTWAVCGTHPPSAYCSCHVSPGLGDTDRREVQSALKKSELVSPACNLSSVHSITKSRRFWSLPLARETGRTWCLFLQHGLLDEL